MSDSTDSYQERLKLFEQLQSLPLNQLDQVIDALNPTAGNIPPSIAAPGNRVAALLTWAESPIGCGREEVKEVLTTVLNTPDYELPTEKPASIRKDTNEKILIEAIWTEVEDRLQQSLHSATLIRLNMAEQRSYVSRPWDRQIRTADQKSKSLDPNTHIADVFDRRDIGGKLLILGNPGSGKTTTMLDLAAVLIQRANLQIEEPIPVMLNLSSWKKSSQSITDWLLEELKLKYGVSPKLGAKSH